MPTHTYNITVNSSTDVNPMTQPITAGPVAIVWSLTGGLSWQNNGVQISQTNSATSGTGSSNWGGGVPTQVGDQYQLTFVNNMSGRYVFTYAVHVSSASGNASDTADDGGSNNPPVIENEGGGGTGDPLPLVDPERD